MGATHYTRFLQFLHEELALSHDEIAIALKRCEQDTGQIAIQLWQYGLVTIDQLDRIYDWFETV
jgi:hypothetical protein